MMDAYCTSVVHFETKLIAELLDAIREIPGEKTLVLLNHSGTHKYEVCRSGAIYCDAGQESKLCCNVAEALRKGGGLYIREVHKIKTLCIDEKNGREVWAPATNLYAIAFGYGKWAGLAAKEVEEALQKDAEIFQLPRDPGIRYKSLDGHISS